MVTTLGQRRRGRPRGSGKRKNGVLSSFPTPTRSSKRLANKAAKNCQELSNITLDADGIARMRVETRHFKQSDGATLAAEHMPDTVGQTHQKSQDGCPGSSPCQAYVGNANLQKEVAIGQSASSNGEKAAGYASSDEDDSTTRENNCPTSNQHLESSSLNYTDMADWINDDDDDDDGDSSEIDSAGFDDRVSVNAYRVRPQNAQLLRIILTKHGDIGANCCLGSVAARSLFMDLVCETLHELMATNLAKISVSRIKRLKASLTDVEKEGIEIGWLKTRLEDILGAKQAIPLLKPSSALKHLGAEHKAKIQVLREQLNACERDVSIKMTEVCTLRNKIKATRNELSQEADEIRKINSKISESKAKLGHIAKLGTLVGDLV